MRYCPEWLEGYDDLTEGKIKRNELLLLEEVSTLPECLLKLNRGDESSLIVLHLLTIASQQDHKLTVISSRLLMCQFEQQTVTESPHAYLSTLADEFSLQKIFSIRSIIFSISSKERHPSEWLKEYPHRDRSGRRWLYRRGGLHLTLSMKVSRERTANPITKSCRSISSF